MNISEFLNEKEKSAAKKPSTEDILLVSSSEGFTYTVTPSTGLYHFSTLIRDLMEFCPHDSSEEPLMLKHVTTKSLQVLIEWCDRHRNDPKISDDEKSDDVNRLIAYPEVDPWDVELFSDLKALEFYDCIQAATYLLISKVAKTVTRVWIHCMKPRIGRDFDNFILREKCLPETEMNARKMYNERDRLFLQKLYSNQERCVDGGIKKVAALQPSTSRQAKDIQLEEQVSTMREDDLNDQMEGIRIH